LVLKSTMKVILLILLIPVLFVACNSESNVKQETDKQKKHSERVFDKTKWRVKEDGDYLYRNQMLTDIVYNDTIRNLNKVEILELLGKPDRVNENYFYYLVKENRLWFWTLHTKTMVIKFTNDSAIEWIRIHE